MTFKLLSDEELADATLYLDGRAHPMSGEGTEWTLELNLPDGAHTFHAEFHDLAGNFNRTEERTFTVDTTSPALSFVPPTPENGSLIASHTIEVVLNASENLSFALVELDGVNHTMNGTGTEWTAELSLGGDGLHRIRAYGKDLAGNSGKSSEVVFESDTLSPEIVWVRENNLTVIGRTRGGEVLKAERKANASIEFNVTEAHPGGYNVYLNPEPGRLNRPIWSNSYRSGVPFGFSVITREVGNGTYVVVISDRAGNSVARTYVIRVVDTTPPGEVENLSVETNSSGFTARWRNPDDDDFQRVELYLDPEPEEKGKELDWEGALVANLTGEPGEAMNFSTSLPHGRHTLYFRTFDRYGNGGNLTRVGFTVPLPGFGLTYVPPTPENGSVLEPEVGRVSIEIVSTVQLRACTLNWNGQELPMNLSGERCDAELTVIPGGDYSFSVEATDVYWRTRTAPERSFSVEGTCFGKDTSLGIEPLNDPKSLVFPVSFTFNTTSLAELYTYHLKAGDVDISGNVTPAFEVVGVREVKKEEGPFTYTERIYTLRGTFTIDLWGLREYLGKYAGEGGIEAWLSIGATDHCGREVGDERAFALCKNAEGPKLNAQLGDFYYRGEDVILTTNGSENVRAFYYSVNGTWIEFNGTTNLRGILKPGENTVEVKAVSPCGTEDSETFRVFIGPPRSGDWIVNTTETCLNREFSVRGSIIVKNTGSLTLRGCKVHVLGWNVGVNGTLNAFEGSLIEGISLNLLGGGNLTVRNSEVAGVDGGVFSGNASFAGSHLVGSFNFSSATVSVVDSDVEGGIIASGSLDVSGSVFHGGSGLEYIRPHWNSPGSLTIVNSTFRNNERGLSFVGTFTDWSWNVKNLLVENNRDCGVYLEETNGQYSQQTLRNVTVRHNGIGVCMKGGGMRLDNSAIYSNGERNFDLDLNRGWMFLSNSVVNGSEYAFIARNVGGIETWNTNVSGSVSPYPTYFILHVDEGKKVAVTSGKAGDFYAYVDGELLIRGYTIEKGRIEVHTNGTLQIEDTDGIPATDPLDRDASVLRNVTMEGLGNAGIVVLNSKLENSHVEGSSRDTLVKGCLVDGGGLAFNTPLHWDGRSTESLEMVMGNTSEWLYSTEEPPGNWIYTTSEDGMSAGAEPFYANAYKSHFTTGTEIGEFTDLYLKRVITLDKLPVQAWLNYYAVSGVEIYVNGRKVVDKLDHEAQLSYTYGWGGGRITAHPLMELVDIAGYLRSGENVIAVHVRSPNRYPYLDLGAFKATLFVVKGMAGLTDSVVNAPVYGGAARLIIARNRINGNITNKWYSRVRISDSTVHGSVKASGRLEILRSNVTGDGTGRGVWANDIFDVLVNESSIRGFGEGTHFNPMGSTGSLEVYSSSIENNGVGLWVYNATVDVRGNYLMRNGMGMVLDKTAGVVRNNLVAGNGGGIEVHASSPGILRIDHNTITGGETGVSFRYGNGGRVMLSNNLIQDNDVGVLFNGSASVAMENNSLINERGVHVIRNPSPMSMWNTDWGGHVPVKVEGYTGGVMYTANGEESENYDILCDVGSLSPGNTSETGPDWGSSLLGAFLNVYPLDKGMAKGVITLAGSARSRSRIVSVNYTLIYNGTEKLIGSASPNTTRYSDFITLDTVAENLTGFGFLRFTAQNAEGTKVSAVRRVYFGNAEIKIDDVSVNHPTALYVYRRYHEGDSRASIPYDERFANVTVMLWNSGDLMGVARIELVLPHYIERHTGRVSMLVAVPAGMRGKFHALIPITVYDFLKLKWDPMPDELPANHRIPMYIRVYDTDGVLRDERRVEISFDLGPVFKIEEYRPHVYTRAWCHAFPKKCHVKNYGDRPQTYDGDGDGDLEAAESHHFDLLLRNVGDGSAYIEGVGVREHIPELNPRMDYKYMKFNSISIWDGKNNVYTIDANSNNITGLVRPGKLKWIYRAWMPWWFDHPPEYIPPVNFSGNYMTTVRVTYRTYENGRKSGWIYTTFSINYKETPVKALNKTFVPFTEMVGPVQVDVVGINGNKTYMRLKNTNDNVYYSYYAEGDYDLNPEGYLWYHVIPPGFEFKAIADHSREPGTVIPHYSVTVGVEYSLLFNELQLVAIGAEGALKVLDIDVPVETIVMGLTKAALKITNIVENIDFPDDETIEEYSNSSSAPQVNSMLISDNTTIVPLTLDDFARWEKDYGMTKDYYYNLTHITEIPMDAKISVMTRLAKAIITDEDLQTLLIETILEVVDNDVANEIYKGIKTAQNGGPTPEDELNANLDEMKEQIKEMLVDYLKEQIKKQKSFQELDPKEQKKALDKSGKSIAAAITTFEKMGEWAFYNVYAILTQPTPMSIQVLDPPANYTVEAEKLDTAIVLGGESGSLDGWGNVSLTLGNPDVYSAEYIVPTPATRVGPLFNGTFEAMRLEISGSGNGTIEGSLRMEIRPDPRNASMVFALFRNEEFARAFISPYMAKIESFSSKIENGTVVITAAGELAALPEDREVEINMSVGRLFTNATIVRRGNYRGAIELKPAFGIDPSKVQTSVGGAGALTGRTRDGSLVVVSTENGTPGLPEITVNPTTLYTGGAVFIGTSKPCPIEWSLANFSGSGLTVRTEGLKPGNYTLTVTCSYGNISVERNFSVSLLKKPVVEKKASGEIVSGKGNEWVRVITNTDLYRVYFLPEGPVDGMLAVYEKPGEVEGYTVYALFNVTHPENWSIRDVTLRFRVPKEWLKENNVSPEEVLLLRHSGEWEEFRPLVEGEDLRYVYYKASVPGLSLFAVAVKVETQTPPSGNQTGETTTPSPTETQGTSTTGNQATQTPSGRANWPYYALIGALIVLIAAYLYRRR
ncbi:PGF-pre-PGF domain-containing protein [Thermococcus sp.]|uniref:PGF-pre-PGF domain-containing protein n=1 Tax=Thermococcus sp. TaxID=35749 RepID=UPI00260590A6|nr:PGF-pre-PGF domain-containing protein [Thermococcus sp.]